MSHADVKLGILSDSHGHVDRVRAAVRLLEDHGATALIHCGDVGGLEALDELAGKEAWFVWGNTDFPSPTWRHHVEAIDLPWPDGHQELSFAGKRIGVFHGHEAAFHHALDAGQYDYILHGHTHRADDYRIRKTRVINPGALHRARTHTVALLEPHTDDLRFLTLPRETR